MSTCRRCNSCDFILDRITGEMKCTNCGSTNYIGSPSDYTPDRFDRETDKGFNTNSIFKGTKE